MNKKATYRSWALQEADQLPLFFQPWWLDAYCGRENWDVAVSIDGNGGIRGVLPFFLRSKFGLTILDTPPLTPFTGPCLIYPPEAKLHNKYAFEKTVLNDLIDQLPDVNLVRIKCHHHLSNGLPFFWKGFEIRTRYTFQVSLADLDIVYQGVNRNVRRNIRQARQNLKVTEERSIEEFHITVQKSFQRQGISFPVSLEELQSRHKVLQEKQAGQMFFAVDNLDRIHSVSYLVWDKYAAYYHLAGDDPQLRNSGAGFLLIWEAMQHAKRALGLGLFDFQGSMIESVAQVRQQFGAVQQPYLQVFKAKNRWLAGGASLLGF